MMRSDGSRMQRSAPQDHFHTETLTNPTPSHPIHLSPECSPAAGLAGPPSPNTSATELRRASDGGDEAEAPEATAGSGMAVQHTDHLAAFEVAILGRFEQESQQDVLQAQQAAAQAALEADEKALMRAQLQRVSEQLACTQRKAALPIFLASYFKRTRKIGGGTFGDAYIETVTMGQEELQVVIKLAKRVGTGAGGGFI